MAQPVEQLAALGNSLRLDVFRFVIGAGINGSSAGEIAEHLRVPASTLSTHLKTLQQAELLQSERIQQRIYYSINHEQVQNLIHFLVSDCCDHNPELCGLDIKP